MRKLHLLTVLFVISFLLGKASIQVVNLTCEYIENPLGLDTTAPTLAWKMTSSERGQSQSAYEIMVALSEEDLLQERKLVWKSGKVKSGENMSIHYGGKILRPFTRYYWKVRVYDQDGHVSTWSQPAWWETSMLKKEDWKAQWIDNGTVPPEKTEDFYQNDPAPLFRKVFETKKTVSEARLYIAGLGYYEASINGERVGDRVLDPGWTNFGKQILYSTYDVTSSIRQGKNSVGVVLGNGFFNPLPIRIFRNLREYLYIGRPCLKAQIRIVYTDGSVETIITDEQWKTGEGPILRNNVYLGEHYDARKEIKGWDETGFDDSAWKQAQRVNEEPTGLLTAQMQPPIRITKVIQPTRMTETRRGEYVFDMGQNFAGVVRLKVKGPKGTTIKIRYGEDVYSDGSLNGMTSVGGQQKTVWDANWELPGQPPMAWQEDSYTLKGEGEEIWSPKFTFHGFRYVEITGWPGRPTLDNVEGLRMNSDLSRSGTFECSNEMFNKLDVAMDYTFKSNIFSVQSDCPAREKYGYGGDIVGVARTFCWYYDMENFYRKAIRDFANDQRPLGGITETAPYNGIADRGLGDGSGPIGWQLGFAFVQKQLYEYYGDLRTIEVYYPAFKKQVEFLRSSAKDHIIDKCINDHESLDDRIPALFATAHYYHHVILLAEFATLTNRKADKELYTQLAEDIKKAFIGAFVKDGRVGNQTPADQAFALYYGLAPEQEKAKAFDLLLEAIEERKGHVTSGIFGVPAILTVLQENNRADIAYEMANKRTFPGWGHMIESGATTLWETWAYSDNVYSHNHPMFGSVGEWFYQTLGGINQGAPGFRKVIIKPQPAGDLTWVNSSYQSIQGNVVSNWKKEGDIFTLEVEVPVNTKATVYLPSAEHSVITEGNVPVKEAEDITLLGYSQGFTSLEIGSGKYLFQVK